MAQLDISLQLMACLLHSFSADSCAQNSEPELKVFQEAARRGIHRTVHAGEMGPAYMVQLVSMYVICRYVQIQLYVYTSYHTCQARPQYISGRQSME